MRNNSCYQTNPPTYLSKSFDNIVLVAFEYVLEITRVCESWDMGIWEHCCCWVV